MEPAISSPPAPDLDNSVNTVTDDIVGINLNESRTESIASDLNSSSDLSECENIDYDLGNLSCLPPEIVQRIVGYLNARFVLTRLSLVCKTLYHLVKDPTTWRLKVQKLSEKSYPVFTGYKQILI